MALLQPSHEHSEGGKDFPCRGNSTVTFGEVGEVVSFVDDCRRHFVPSTSNAPYRLSPKSNALCCTVSLLFSLLVYCDSSAGHEIKSKSPLECNTQSPQVWDFQYMAPTHLLTNKDRSWGWGPGLFLSVLQQRVHRAPPLTPPLTDSHTSSPSLVQGRAIHQFSSVMALPTQAALLPQAKGS